MNASSGIIQCLQTHNLFRQFQNGAGSLLWFESRVRSASFYLHLVNARTFASRLNASTDSGRLEYKCGPNFFLDSDFLQQRPTGKATNFFITHQRQNDSASRLYIEVIQSMQQRYGEGTVAFHIEYAWPIDAIVLQPPGTTGEGASRMNGVRVSDQQNVSGRGAILECSDYQMLAKVWNIKPINGGHTTSRLGCLSQQIHNGATTRNVSRRRLRFH